MAQVLPGMHVVSSPYCSTPTTLLNELAARAAEAPGIRLSGGMLLGDLSFSKAIADGSLSMKSWHLTGELRALATGGRLQYLPMRASGVGGYLSCGVDVALVRISPPDSGGWCSLGPSASFTKRLVREARYVIAEVDPLLPRPVGDDTRIRFSDVDVAIDSEIPFPELPEGGSSRVSDRIGELVVELVPDGASLQLGIGATPQVVASKLSTGDVSDLRIVGLACDSVADLLRSGRLVKKEPVVAAEIIGTEKIFRLADGNPEIRLASSETVHNPRWLAEQPRLISVCSALAVDLWGQVASEGIRGKMIAGIGGSVDFLEGAGMSAGGRRIIALPATTASGESRIVARLGSSTPVTVARHSVDTVVTEYGIAEIAGLSVEDRARALTAIAAPQHREQLLAASERR